MKYKAYKRRELTAHTQGNIQAVRHNCELADSDASIRNWKPIAVQALYPEDEDRRLKFAETFLDLHRQRQHLFENIVWSEEVGEEVSCWGIC